MPFLTYFSGGKALIGNPLPNLQIFHIPMHTNIAPVNKSIYPGSSVTGRGIVTVFLVNLAHKMRIRGMIAANSNPYRILPVISFDFPILQFQIMICNLIRKQNLRKPKSKSKIGKKSFLSKNILSESPLRYIFE